MEKKKKNKTTRRESHRLQHALAGCTLLVFTKPERHLGCQTSYMQAAQVLVTDITKPLHHTGSGSVQGWGMEFYNEKTLQHNRSRKLFHIGDIRSAYILEKKKKVTQLKLLKNLPFGNQSPKITGTSA